MITTPIYKFKKRQLTDAPNIEVGEDNWDIAEVELSKKIDKTQIKNTLTETASGNVLDATQGKILSDRIDSKADKSHTHDNYVNQNAFTNIKVGELTIVADSPMDTIEIVAGDNVSIEADTLSDKITISATDTIYTHPNDANTRHVTDEEKVVWNAKESTAGSQAKATKALADAKTYTDEKVLNLISDVRASMKINTLEVHKNNGTVEEIQLNIKGSDGAVNNVFRSGGKQGEFTAQEVTNTFTIPDMNNTKEVFLVYEGSVLIENNNFVIEKSTGVVTLDFSLQVGETVHYEVIDTSFDYNELKNTPQIQNNLTTESTGSVLDAHQGKVLKEEMGDISALQTVDKTSLVNAINELKRTGGSGGATLNVFKRTGGTWGEFTATHATNTFDIVGFNGTEKCLDVYYKGLPLIPDKHFNVSQTGTVTLGFELAINESVDYCVSDVSFNYNDLANKPNLDLKADKTQITTLDDKILSLSQNYAVYRTYTSPTQVRSDFNWSFSPYDIARAMVDRSILIADVGGSLVGAYYPTNMGVIKIHKISDGRIDFEFTSTATNTSTDTKQWVSSLHSSDTSFKGWKEVVTSENVVPKIPIIPTITDFNELVENGKYYCSGFSNAPDGVGGQWYVEVIALKGSENLLQIAHRRINTSSSVMYTRNRFNGTWNGWACISSGIPGENFTTGQDLNTITRIGVYTSSSTTLTTSLINKPIEDSGYVEFEVKSIRALDTKYLVQTFTLRTTSTKPRIFERVSFDAGVTWKDWYEIGTTSKTSVTITPKTGFTIVSNNCYTINNILYINCVVKATSGAIVANKSVVEIFTIPSNLAHNGVRSTLSACLWMTSNNVSKADACHAFLGSGPGVFYSAYSNEASADAIMITGEVVLS